MQATRTITLASLNGLVDKAIFGNLHNVIVIWAELGQGKTSLLLWMLYRLLKDWGTVLSFKLEPHVCQVCGKRWDSKNPYAYEVGCSCGKEETTSSLKDAISAVYKRWYVNPFPFDLETGILRKFPEGQTWILNPSKARGEIHQEYPYLNFSFHEIRASIENAVETRVRLPMIGWDDISVYFHRSNIQYMNPLVKNFFSRYSFVRKYVANVVVTVPDPTFVPEQLVLFCTADIMLTSRGAGDFDIKKKRRSFYGHAQTWTKHYDGQDVSWAVVPEEYFRAYEEIRHAHAVEAFEHPEDIMVTTMPKQGREFTEAESLISTEAKPQRATASFLGKKDVAEALRFQGSRVTESYDATEPDIVVWKDATTPSDVIAVKQTVYPMVINIAGDCGKEIEFAKKYGLSQIHLICLDAFSKKKVFDNVVSFTERVAIEKPVDKDDAAEEE